MTYRLILIIQCFSILILGLESAYIFYKWKTKGQSYLFIFCFASFINNIGYLAVMTSQTLEEASIASRFSYVGKVWIPLSFFAMVMELCDVNIHKWIYQILVAIQLAFMFLVLSSGYHNYFYTEYREFVQTGLFPHCVFGHAFLYKLYMGLMFAYVGIGIVIMIRVVIKDRNPIKQQMYVWLVLGVVAMTGGLVAYLMGVTGGYDSTSLGYAITSLIMAVVIFKYRIMDTLSLVKDYIADTITEGIVVTNLGGRAIYYNNQMNNIFKDFWMNTKEIVNEIRKKSEEKEVIRLKDNIYEPIRTPLYRDKELIGQMYVISDVTARYKHMEELQEQKDIAEAANLSKSAFLSVVSHEIRTPMNAVVGMTNLILKEADNLTEKQIKYLKNIHTSGDALVMIVNDILDQSKIEAGKMELVENIYDMYGLVEDVRMIIENRIEGKKIELKCEIDDGIPKYLVGDGLRIRQVLINLMNNAVKFTDSGYIKLGIICEEKQKDKKKLKFVVKDSGQGIKPEDLEKIGEAFTQFDVKKNHSKEGTGLGLSISRDFISMMGGKLGVDSNYGEGTEFYFSIWQGIASEDALMEMEERQSVLQEEIVFKAPEANILVVDDTDLNLIIAKGLLESVSSNIDVANSGEKAIELIKQKRYDMIFMDYRMPYMNGLEATELIRQMAEGASEEWEREYYKKVPIIALTGEQSPEARKKIEQSGMNDFILKPVEEKSLKIMVQKWLPKSLIMTYED